MSELSHNINNNHVADTIRDRSLDYFSHFHNVPVIKLRGIFNGGNDWSFCLDTARSATISRFRALIPVTYSTNIIRKHVEGTWVENPSLVSLNTQYTQVDFFKIAFCEFRIQNVADTTQPTTPIENPGPQLFKNIYVCLPIPNTHGDRALQSKWILSDHRSPKYPKEPKPDSWNRSK